MLFQHLAFELPPGQLAWVRGHNGRGKTSLLRLAAGLSAPERGEVLHDGRPAHRLRDGDQRPVFIGHANALKDDLTATEALQFLLRLHGRAWDTPTAHAALQRLGLPGRRHAPVRTLSQGQRRRVALARLAVEREPALWILDEPFDALDADGMAVLNELLADHLSRSGSVLLTSHLPLDVGLLRPTRIELDNYA
jgi:heme exporter protein A